jgi:hypothetical protein
MYIVRIAAEYIGLMWPLSQASHDAFTNKIIHIEKETCMMS